METEEATNRLSVSGVTKLEVVGAVLGVPNVTRFSLFSIDKLHIEICVERDTLRISLVR